MSAGSEYLEHSYLTIGCWKLLGMAVNQEITEAVGLLKRGSALTGDTYYLEEL
jgi:hypothetical protein